MVFDHTKDKIGQALGLSDDDLSQLAGRLSEITTECLMTDNKPSKLGEKLAQELSYTELIFIATQFVMDKVESISNESSEMLSKLKDLQKLLDRLHKKSGLDNND
jgi:hypothetical protein